MIFFTKPLKKNRSRLLSPFHRRGLTNPFISVYKPNDKGCQYLGGIDTLIWMVRFIKPYIAQAATFSFNSGDRSKTPSKSPRQPFST